MKDLRRAARAPKECATDQSLANRLLKKHDRGSGRRRIRYPVTEKLGIERSTFCRWYGHYLEGSLEALADRPSTPSRVWNRIPDAIHDRIIELALEAAGTTVLHKPRLLTLAQIRGIIAGRPQLHRGRTGGIYLRPEDEPRRRCPGALTNPEQDRALPPDPEESHPTRKLLPARRP